MSCTVIRHNLEPIFKVPANPLYSINHTEGDTSESWARCSPVTPHMKPDSLRPPGLFQSLVCFWQLSSEIALGFYKSHPCVAESHSVFYSEAEPDPVMCMQNPSLFTTPWQRLSDLVILHKSSARLQTKLQLTPGSRAVTAQSLFLYVKNKAHRTADEIKKM